MSKAAYFASLAAMVAFIGVAEVLPESLKVPLILLAVLAATLWWRIRPPKDEEQDQEFRRKYDAPREAVYIALCGAFGESDYRTTRDAATGRIEFRGGKLGPWISRYGAEGTATVQQAGDGRSEVVIVGHISKGEKHGAGFWFLPYPEGMAQRASHIMDRVQTTLPPLQPAD